MHTQGTDCPVSTTKGLLRHLSHLGVIEIQSQNLGGFATEIQSHLDNSPSPTNFVSHHTKFAQSRPLHKSRANGLQNPFRSHLICEVTPKTRTLIQPQIIMPQITRKHRANAQIGEALHSAVLAVSESYQRLWETPNIADQAATTLQNDGLDVLKTAYTVLSALVSEANANAVVKVD